MAERSLFRVKINSDCKYLEVPASLLESLQNMNHLGCISHQQLLAVRRIYRSNCIPFFVALKERVLLPLTSPRVMSVLIEFDTRKTGSGKRFSFQCNAFPLGISGIRETAKSK
jgi:hypothetical protein